MTLDPILSAPAAVQIHVAAGLLALSLGPVALYRKKRDRVHKTMGYIWIVAMTVLAVTAFFIEAVVLPLVGPFGPIHLFGVWALISMYQGMEAILCGQVWRHQAIMRALYWQALGITSLLTLLPGRRLNEMLFGDAPEMGFVAIALAVVTFAFIRVRGRLHLAK